MSSAGWHQIAEAIARSHSFVWLHLFMCSSPLQVWWDDDLRAKHSEYSSALESKAKPRLPEAIWAGCCLQLVDLLELLSLCEGGARHAAEPQFWRYRKVPFPLLIRTACTLRDANKDSELHLLSSGMCHLLSNLDAGRGLIEEPEEGLVRNALLQ